MRTLSEYFAEVFGPGVRVRKIGVNASLGCPNRDGTVGHSGCIYCNNSAFTPSYADPGAANCKGPRKSITRQLEEGIRFYSVKEHADAFLAYFQSYSNTYGPTEKLISLYEEALSYPEVVGLIIATRPDCLKEDLLDYFERRFRCRKQECRPEGHQEYSDKDTEKPYLMIELGVESTCDRTLKAINRGHDWACAKDAIERLSRRGIPVGVHLIIGLPGETLEDYRHHIREISALEGVTSLKLHQLQVISDTPLESIWRQSCSTAQNGLPAKRTQDRNVSDGIQGLELQLLCAEQYAAILRDILPLLRPDIVVDRLVSESPSSMLLAPRWGLKPSQFAALLNK